MMRRSVEEVKAEFADMSYVDKLHLKEYIDRSTTNRIWL